ERVPVLHLADLHAAERDGRALVEAAHRAREEDDEAVLRLEPVGGAERHHRGHDERDRAEDEGAHDPGMRPGAHSAAPGRCPRERNARTFGSGESLSSLGRPSATMVLRSASRNTALSPSSKMLGSSWVTSTIVVPALSRSSRMRSSSRRELKGSSPAEGSSK